MELCDFCSLDLAYEDKLCKQCLGYNEINTNFINMKVDIPFEEWEDNYNFVVKTVESCGTEDQLNGARKVASNFFDTYDTSPDEHVHTRRAQMASLITYKSVKITNGII